MSGSFKKLFSAIEKTLSYKKEKAKLDFTIELQTIIEKKGVTRADLARQLGKSNAYVSQMLGGERNFTIDTMVELADALDSNLAIHFSPKGEKTVDWYRVIQGAQGQRRTSARASARKIHGLTEEDVQSTDVMRCSENYFNEGEADGYAFAS